MKNNHSFNLFGGHQKCSFLLTEGIGRGGWARNRDDFLRKGCILVFMVLLISTLVMGEEAVKDRFTVEDMLGIVGFVRGSGPVISPTGDLVAYMTVDATEEKAAHRISLGGFDLGRSGEVIV